MSQQQSKQSKCGNVPAAAAAAAVLLLPTAAARHSLHTGVFYLLPPTSILLYTAPCSVVSQLIFDLHFPINWQSDLKRRLTLTCGSFWTSIHRLHIQFYPFYFNSTELRRKTEKLKSYHRARLKLNVFVASRDNYKSFHSFHFKQLDIVRDMYQCCQCFLYICITSVCWEKPQEREK